MPTSTALGSPESMSPKAGVTLLPHSEHGQVIATVLEAVGLSVLPLSSLARAMIVALGLPWATHVWLQAVGPEVAGCHVLPPSVDTSTPATTPPASDAVPEMDTRAPSATVAGSVLIVDTGAVWSADWVAATIPAISVAGCAPMSANRLIVACCMFGSGALPAWFSLS